MTQIFQTLSPQDLADVVAYTFVATGLSSADQTKSDRERWQETQQGTFGDYLVQQDRLDQETLKALLTIANRTFNVSPETTQERATVWLRGDQDISLDIVAHRQPSSESDRFEIVSEHRRGGLGEVFLARDRQLNRQVALKQIKAGYSKRPELCNRFLVEAELTGGLEHPGIVPVYGLGKTPTGSPFYAMKFIQGQSLGDAIKRLHEKSEHQLDSIEFRKLLRRFITVCYTIHFSHTRGILHRDIKPDNIMLGDFDETLVVDWGIAKVMGNKERKEKGTLYPASKGPNDNTQLGTVVGSPGFMSGEQALGWHDSLGPQSDVFGLGATLFAMVTGRPPFEGESVDDVLQNTIADKFTPCRDINSKVPKPLDAICTRALQSTKSKRYPTALALAEDLEAYLADEPVSAWAEPASVKVRRWMKKHRTAVSVGISGLMLLTVGAIVSSAMLAAANSREVQAKEDATENFSIAKSVVDDFLKQLADDPRLESASLEGLTGELLAKAETLQKELQATNRTGLLLDIDRADTAHRIAAVASKLGQNKKANQYLAEARELLLPHLEEPENADRAYRLLSQVLLDHSRSLTKTDDLEAAIKANEEGIKFAAQRFANNADARSLTNKILHLAAKDLGLQNLKGRSGLAEIRKQYWTSVKQFFDMKKEDIAEHEVNIARSVLNKVALNEQERDTYQTVRIKCLATLKKSIESAQDDSLADRRTKAEDSSALATAYATLDDKKNSYEVGMASADLWYDLSEDTPNVVSFRRKYIWSVYNAFLIRQEYEVAIKNAKVNSVKPLTADEVQTLATKSAKMYEGLAASNDAEAKAIYAHLVSNFASYLKSYQAAPELVDDFLNQAIELQKDFDTKNNANARLVRNEIMRSAGIHYMTTGNQKKGRQVLEAQVVSLRKTLQERPDEFIAHRQLYDLQIVRMILEGVFGPNASKEARENAIVIARECEEDSGSIPESVREQQQQQIAGMRARVFAMLHDVLEIDGQLVEAQLALDQGTDEFQQRKLKIDNSAAVVFVAELHQIAVDSALKKKAYTKVVSMLDYLIENASLPPNRKVQFLADRAFSNLKTNSLEQATKDCQAAIPLADQAFQVPQIKLAMSLAAVSCEHAKQADPKTDLMTAFDKEAKQILLKMFKDKAFDDASNVALVSELPQTKRFDGDPELALLLELINSANSTD